MTSIVAVGPVTVGINLTSSQAELRELDLIPGSFSLISVEQIEAIRLTLEQNRGTTVTVTLAPLPASRHLQKATFRAAEIALPY